MILSLRAHLSQVDNARWNQQKVANVGVEKKDVSLDENRTKVPGHHDKRTRDAASYVGATAFD